jgi:hypothetical protein
MGVLTENTIKITPIGCRRFFRAADFAKVPLLAAAVRAADFVGGSDLLDGGEQPLSAAAAADKGPHLLGLDRAARVAAD